MQPSARFPNALESSRRIVAVPSSDLEFARDVRELAGARLGLPVLEERLRRRYPRARVRPNDLSGRDAVWYAYRDGRWESGRSG
jgi:hypothetical protein